MRIPMIAAAALMLAPPLAIAPAALAAPAAVSVTLSPELQTKAEKTYGLRDVSQLADELRVDAERALARTGAYADTRIELVMTDVTPNRPTFKQLGDKPGLSFQSFGVGGAAFSGRIIAADGSETPLAYKWYESDIDQAFGNSTWGDARWAIDRFAARLARGQTLARR
jgi:hypothetical protein